MSSKPAIILLWLGEGMEENFQGCLNLWEIKAM